MDEKNRFRAASFPLHPPCGSSLRSANSFVAKVLTHAGLPLHPHWRRTSPVKTAIVMKTTRRLAGHAKKPRVSWVPGFLAPLREGWVHGREP
jgi:hypothetical protein